MMEKRRVVAAWVAVAVVVAMGRTAHGQSTDPHEHAAEPGTALLAPGETVPEFDARGIDGAPRHVGFPKTGPTVLLFFSSGCPVCRRMIPIWNEKLAKKPKNLNVVGVIVDQEPPGFFNTYPVTFPVVRLPGRELGPRGGDQAARALMERYKVARVPMTLRVNPGGAVESAATGMLDPIKLGELFRP